MTAEPASLTAATPIALLITGLEVGGAEQAFTNLALGLTERGFSPKVYALQARPPAGEDRLVERLESAGIACEFFGARSAFDASRAAGHALLVEPTTAETVGVALFRR